MACPRPADGPGALRKPEASNNLVLWCPQDADGCPIDIKVIPNGDGTFRCSYVPTKPIKHTIIVSWGGVNVPKSPFRVCPPRPVPADLQGPQRMGGAPRWKCGYPWTLVTTSHLKAPSRGPIKAGDGP